MKHTLRAFLLVAIAFIGLGFTQHAFAATYASTPERIWNTPQQIAFPSQFKLNYNFDVPRVVRDSQDRLTAIFTDDETRTLYVSKIINNALETPQALFTVASSTNGTEKNTIVISKVVIDKNDTIHVLWEENWMSQFNQPQTPGTFKVWYSAFKNMAWSTPLQINKTPIMRAYDVQSKFTLDENGNAYIGWSDDDYGYNQLNDSHILIQKIPATGPWPAVERLNSQQPMTFDMVATNDGHLQVVFLIEDEARSATMDKYFYMIRDTDGTWSSPSKFWETDYNRYQLVQGNSKLLLLAQRTHEPEQDPKELIVKTFINGVWSNERLLSPTDYDRLWYANAIVDKNENLHIVGNTFKAIPGGSNLTWQALLSNDKHVSPQGVNASDNFVYEVSSIDYKASSNSLLASWIEVKVEPNGDRNFFLMVNTADLNSSLLNVPVETLHEDAEDGNTAGWALWLPNSTYRGTVANVADDAAHGRAIEINVSNPYYQEFKFTKTDGSPLNDPNKILTWDMKTGGEMFVYAYVDTNKGPRFVMYSFGFSTGLISSTYSLRMPAEYKDGTWHTITRDLEADMRSLDPSITINKIGYLMVGGQGRFDNIKTTNVLSLHSISGKITDAVSGAPITDANVKLSPLNYTTVTDQNGQFKFTMLKDGDYSLYASAIQYAIQPAGATVSLSGADVTNANFSGTATGYSTYEDAEDGDTLGWFKFAPGSTVPATVTNVFDTEKNSRVIEMDVANANYQDWILSKPNQTYWNNQTEKTLTWDMKTSADMYVYAFVNTNKGNKYVFYSFGFRTGILGSYYSLRMDPSLMDGKWHSYARNLETDLMILDPTIKINYVYDFMAGGKGRFDNIRLRNVPAGTLTIAAEDINRSKIIAADSTTWQSLAQFRVSAKDEASTIDRIAVSSTGDAASFTAIAIAKDGAVLGQGVLPAGKNTSKDIDLSTNPVFVPKDGYVTLQLWGKISYVQSSSSANGATDNVPRSGASVGLGIASGLTNGQWNTNYQNKANIHAIGSASGSPVYSTDDDHLSNIVYTVRKTKPFVARQSLVSTTLASGADMDLYKFSVGADTNGNATLKRVVFTIVKTTSTGSTLNLNNFRIRKGSTDISPSNVKITNAETGADLRSGSLTGSTSIVSVEFVTEESIQGSGNVYTLHATVSGTVVSGDSVLIFFYKTGNTTPVTGFLTKSNVMLSGILGPHIVNTTQYDIPTATGSFIWSDMSDAPHYDADGKSNGSYDWINEVGVNDLISAQILSR